MPDNAFSRLRSDVLAAFPRFVEELSDELGPRQRGLLAQSRERLEQGTCHVVVVGEYKRGKSTLLNALVERPGLFPVDVDVATCVVSTLAWGEQERAVVHLGDPVPGGDIRRLEVDLAELPEYVTEQGNPGNRRNVRLVEIQAPVPQLEGGLVVVDTPGVGSLNGEHTAATHAFLERADGLVFVCDAIEPLATYELDFLSRALTKCEVVITAVTKTDKVRDARPVVAGAREKIAVRTGTPADSLVIVPVSAFRKLKWLRDRADDQLLADSGFLELDQELWGGLATAGCAVQVRRALDGLSDAVATAGSPLVNELAALESDESLQRIRGQVAETTAQIKQLSSGSAGWRTELPRRFETDTRQTRAALQDAFDAVLRQYQEKVTAGADPGSDELIGEVATGMLKALTEAHGRLAAVSVKVMEEFARRTSLQLTSAEAPKPPFTPSIAVPTVPLNVRPTRFFDAFRASWSTGMAGLGAGAGVAMIEPFSGLAVAAGLGTMGFIHGVRNHRQDLRERAERERSARLLQLVGQEIAANRRHASETFNQAYGDIAQSLVKELNGQLAAQQESLAESGRRLQEASRHTKETLTRRRGELLARQQQYRQLQGELDRLRSRVDRLATPRTAPLRPQPARQTPPSPPPSGASPSGASPSGASPRTGPYVPSTVASAGAAVAAVAGEVAVDLALNAATQMLATDVTATEGTGADTTMAPLVDTGGPDLVPTATPGMDALPQPSGTDAAVHHPDIGASFDPGQFDTP
ncbi:dynamin family protein [Streptomyces sp. NPDC002668]|uniref:dynamin family protein n=1 Tax=Streptomyces sp. NPDC002668 TaxID=3154422 RepID=UPI0033248ED4